MALVPVDAVTAVLASLATLRDLVRDWEQSATAYRKSSEEWQRQVATLRQENARLRERDAQPARLGGTAH
jgi:hypothetical protein